MSKKLYTWLISSMAVLLVFFANSGVGPNSVFALYEPDIPESLKK
ncbi:MAG: cyclic lactone autoinducer peptide [Syntrophomonadaceae bacterium]|nr:cyclic lactone autoinducer peptide [Syntrophomonadaceae bacterium]